MFTTLCHTHARLGFSAFNAVVTQSSPASDSALQVALSHRAMARILDIVDYGLLLAAHDGRVTFANSVARAELAAGNTLCLQAGVVSAPRAADAVALRQALQASTRRAAQTLVALGDEAGARMGVSVVPLQEPGESPATLLILGKRQDCEELSRDAFARRHEITLAETRVLKRLCSGERPTEIARRLGVQLTTVRTQICSIRLKTGARTIGQVVQLFSRLPPLPCLMRPAA